MNDVDAVVAALRAGKPVVLPFDTVYGLAADASGPEPARLLYRLKGRADARPTAVVAANVAALVELIPELNADADTLRRLLPGKLTLVLPNPARRFAWITGTTPDTIGVRVPDLVGPGRDVLEQVGAVIATSANRPGEADPRTLEEVPADLRAGAGAVVDGGDLPGTPSTVVDLTGSEPHILRVGAVTIDEIRRRLGTAVRSR